jgi:hypothetical protein
MAALATALGAVRAVRAGVADALADANALTGTGWIDT